MQMVEVLEQMISLFGLVMVHGRSSNFGFIPAGIPECIGVFWAENGL